MSAGLSVGLAAVGPGIGQGTAAGYDLTSNVHWIMNLAVLLKKTGLRRWSQITDLLLWNSFAKRFHCDSDVLT